MLQCCISLDTIQRIR